MTVSGRYDPETIQGFDAPASTLLFTTDSPLRIPLPYSEKPISGVVVYAADKITAKNKIKAYVEDEDKNIIGKKRHQTTNYKQDGLPGIRLFFTNIKQEKKHQYFLVISSYNNEQNALVGTPEKLLVYSLLYKEPVAVATKLGVNIGTALALCFVVMYYIQIQKKWKWVGAGIIVCVFSVLATLPYLYRIGDWGIFDWDYRHSLSYIYQTSIREYHQFPLWNPYICGGSAALGDPEFAFFTPSFLLQFIFGVENGTGLAITLGFMVTGIGMLFLAKTLRLEPFSALLSASIVVFSTALSLKVTEGHTTIVFAFMWVPWILFAWITAYKANSKIYNGWIFLCAVFLSLALLQGGIYILSYTVLAFAALCVLAHKKKHALQISWHACVWMLGLTAFQLIPTLFWILEFPDQAFVGSAYTFTNFWDIFFGRYLQNVYVIKNQLSRWHEYGAYVGYGVFTLIIVGISYIKQSRIVRILVIGVVLSLAVSSLGPFFEPTLQYLQFLPRSNISRLVLFTLLFGGLLAGYGMKRLIHILPPQLSFIPVIIAGFICIDLLSIQYMVAEQGFSIPRLEQIIPNSPKPISHTTDTFDYRINSSDTPRAYAAILKGYGTSSFCSVIGPKPAVTTTEITSANSQYIWTNTDAETQLLTWTPNKIIFSYEADEDSDIFINSNNAHGWKTSVGFIQQKNPILTIHVPAGKHTVTVKYQPPGMLVGIAISLITVCGIFLYRKKLFQFR